jgi:hypothetical protein
MSEWTDFLSALNGCLFGIAAILAAIFFLKMVSRFDRIITLAEKKALIGCHHGSRGLLALDDRFCATACTCRRGKEHLTDSQPA